MLSHRIRAGLLAPLGLVVAVALATAAPARKVPKDYELKGKAYSAWQKIKRKHVHYRSCMLRYKLRFRCGKCEYAYVVARMAIKANGRLAPAIKVIKGNVCGRKRHPGFARCLLKPLGMLTYPAPLRGKTFDARLGTGLKC